MFAERRAAIQRRLRNGCGGVRMENFISQPFGFFATPGVAQEVIDIHQSGPGNNAFITYVAKEPVKVAKQIHFQFIAGSEICVTAFAGKNMMLFAIPVDAGLTETGASRYDRLIANCLAVARVQQNQVGGREERNAPSVGFKIVDKTDAAKFSFRNQMFGVDDPWQIGSFDAAVTNRPCDAETGQIGAER